MRAAGPSKPRRMSTPAPAPGSWLASVPEESALHAAALRLLPLRCARTEAGAFWLTGPALDAALEARLHTVPGLQLWELLPAGGLRKSGDILPARKVPESLEWLPIAEAFPSRLPAPAFAESGVAPALIRLVRSDEVRPATVLLTDLSRFADWVETAPEVRLARLRFAVSQDGRVVISGSPLPPVEGELWFAEEGVAAPCGWTWQPALCPAALRRAERAPDGALLMISPQGTRLIFPEQLLPATRASVRASVRMQTD